MAVIVVAALMISRLRVKGGRQTASSLYGSTYEFLNEDQQRAAEVLVEQKAHKKMREDHSGQSAGEGDGEPEDLPSG